MVRSLSGHGVMVKVEGCSDLSSMERQEAGRTKSLLLARSSNAATGKNRKASAARKAAKAVKEDSGGFEDSAEAVDDVLAAAVSDGATEPAVACFLNYRPQMRCAHHHFSVCLLCPCARSRRP
jgi:hypothetical protein